MLAVFVKTGEAKSGRPLDSRADKDEEPNVSQRTVSDLMYRKKHGDVEFKTRLRCST